MEGKKTIKIIKSNGNLKRNRQMERNMRAVVFLKASPKTKKKQKTKEKRLQLLRPTASPAGEAVASSSVAEHCPVEAPLIYVHPSARWGRETPIGLKKKQQHQ